MYEISEWSVLYERPVLYETFYFRSLKIVHHDIIVVLVVFKVIKIWHFLQYSYLNNVDSPLGYAVCFLTLTYYLWYARFITSDPLSKFIPFYLVSTIVFSFTAHAFYYFGTLRRFLWNGTEVSQWRFHDNRHMNTSVDFLNSKFYQIMFKCWILLKLVLGGVGDSLHLTVPSINRLNYFEPATFSVLPFWPFRDSYCPSFCA
jgi:hypothetical protein